MQVEVMRTIASRLLRIVGSGTFSTLSLYGAHQIKAFMTISFCCKGSAQAETTVIPSVLARNLGVAAPSSTPEIPRDHARDDGACNFSFTLSFALPGARSAGLAENG